MKFSVIIPLYNKAPYVRKALESVLAQTYTDFELIVVDDGSTDESANIAETMLREINGYRLEVKGQDNSIAETNAYNLSPINYKLIRQANAGVAAARNNGVAQANGDYLAFLDADDWWEPTYLERMAQLIEDYPEAGLYACNYYYYKNGKNIVKIPNIKTGYINYPKTYFDSFAMPITSITAVIPRKVFDIVGGFPLNIRLGEDFLFWAKIALKYKVVFLNELLAYYNNTIPYSKRATHNLHAPKYHMLFNLQYIFGTSEDTSIYTCNPMHATTNDWKKLIDMLRLFGLYDYWLSDEYHDVAQQELNKVNPLGQRDFLIKMYENPRKIQKIINKLLMCGYSVRQLIYRSIGKEK